MGARKAHGHHEVRRGYNDGLGSRAVSQIAPGRFLEQLHLSPEFAVWPSFRPALMESLTRFAAFAHPNCAPAPMLAVTAGGPMVVLEAPYTPGRRLAMFLAERDRDGLRLPTAFAVHLLREVAGALAALHAAFPGAFHGAIGPDRVLLTASTRVVVMDYVLGPALATLPEEPPALMWQRLGLAALDVGGQPRFGPLTDQMQLGLLAIVLLLGRPLSAADFPDAVPDLFDALLETDFDGNTTPVREPLLEWIGRALGMAPDGFFADMEAARVALHAATDDGWGAARPLEIEVRPEPLPLVGTDQLKVLPGGVPDRSNPSGVVERAGAPHDASTHQADGAASRPQAGTFPPVLGALAVDPERASPGVQMQLAPSPDTAAAGGTTDPPRRQGARAARVRAGEEHADESDALPRYAPKHLRDEFALNHLDAAILDRAAADFPAHTGTTAPAVLQQPPGDYWRRFLRTSMIALVAGLTVLGTFMAVQRWRARAAEITTGFVRLDTRPPGASVIVGGRLLGRTPVTVTLPAGMQQVQLRNETRRETIRVDVKPGTEVRLAVSLWPEGPPGEVMIATQPTGANVAVDGEPRGVSPLTVTDLAPGEHVVALELDAIQSEQTIVVQPGESKSVTIPVVGWVQVVAPVDLRVLEDARLVGASQSGRIALSSGRHRLELVNDGISYREFHVIDITAGQVTRLAVSLPTGLLQLTSDQPADVTLDGQPVGRTPLRNLSASVGIHELLFTNSQYGEVRDTVLVGLASNRLHVVFQSKVPKGVRPYRPPGGR